MRPLAYCDEPDTEALTLAVEGSEDRSLLLAAVGGLLLELVDDPRGPSVQSLDEAAGIAAELVRGDPAVEIPVGVVSAFGRHLGERLAAARPA